MSREIREQGGDEGVAHTSEYQFNLQRIRNELCRDTALQLRGLRT